MNGQQSSCRGCGRPIQWRVTANGKRMPLDVEPWHGDELRGAYALDGHDGCIAAMTILNRITLRAEPVYLNHWATCPDRDSFRTQKGFRS